MLNKSQKLYSPNPVREVNSCDYSKAQVKAWAPDNIYWRILGKNWRRFDCVLYVADDRGIIAGFGELEHKWAHRLVSDCHKNYQRMGIGSQILSGN